MFSLKTLYLCVSPFHGLFQFQFLRQCCEFVVQFSVNLFAGQPEHLGVFIEQEIGDELPVLAQAAAALGDVGGRAERGIVKAHVLAVHQLRVVRSDVVV